MDSIKIGDALYVSVWLIQYMAVMFLTYFMYKIKTKPTFIAGNVLSAALCFMGISELNTSKNLFYTALDELIKKYGDMLRPDTRQRYTDVFNTYAAALFCFVVLFAEMFSKFFDFGSFAGREAFFISLFLGIPIIICENIKRRRGLV